MVGADGDAELGFFSGAVYVFTFDGKLLASDAARDDAFGCAVAVSNNTVLVGAFGRSDVAFNAGAAYIYEF